MITAFAFVCMLSCGVDVHAQESAAQGAETTEAPRSLQGGEVRTLFDGETLDGWRGRDDLWAVEEGMIVGRTSADDPIRKNTFLILNDEVSGDFELTLQYKIEGGNSGIQYHSVVLDEEAFVVSGYQADIDFANRFAGILYEERGRGILALRGQSVVVTDEGKKEVETFADAVELGNGIHPGEWNDYRVVVRGNQREHYINETLTMKLIDRQSEKSRDSGVIALQLHQGPAMTVRFKNITMRQWK
ncbi:3-keto-disaccharide hydrolase [Aporhodopirellula aestuarii]|uniref:DUF1080 domain-containing protein n=1 Tax=Aporhodopirellula aestuarii TaxID=2950107 RepID=A0ABT0U4D3_9BACT|nr:DUF1080 domain-containing protein [Aporhodopirellula aestuarii]MCM2371717.1 DUF1080 domain-containing protein [Aporhodopirellula aestuarii]